MSRAFPPSALLILFCGGCTRTYHAPSQHVTLLDGPGQAAARGAIGLHGLQADVAVAPVNHVALRLSGQAWAEKAGVYGVVGGGPEFFVRRGKWLIAFSAEFHGGYQQKRYPQRESVYGGFEPALDIDAPFVQAFVPVSLAATLEGVRLGVAERTGVHIEEKVDWRTPYGGWRPSLVVDLGLFMRWGKTWQGELQVGMSNRFRYRQSPVGPIASIGLIYAPQAKR